MRAQRRSQVAGGESRDHLVLTVRSLDGLLFEGPVRSMRLPVDDGSIGVWPNHAPLVSPLRCGTISVIHASGETEAMVIGPGFAQVSPHRALLLVEFMNAQSAVDMKRAHGAMLRALERLEEREERADLVRAEAALCRAIARLDFCGCRCDICACRRRP